MSVTVRVPTTLRTLTGGASEVTLEGATVGEVLTALEAAHPGFKDRLLDGDGGLRRFVNLYVSDDDVRFLDGLDTPVPDGETVAIIPARYRSTRLPGKALAVIGDRPMICHVADRTRRARGLGDVIVATDDARIRDTAQERLCRRREAHRFLMTVAVQQDLRWSGP